MQNILTCDGANQANHKEGLMIFFVQKTQMNPAKQGTKKDSLVNSVY